MAITVNKRTVRGNGKSKIVLLECNFSTTDTSGSVTVGELRVIEHFSFGMIGSSALAAAETLSLSESSHLAQGIIVVAAAAITVARVGASVTSGLHFMLRLEGY